MARVAAEARRPAAVELAVVFETVELIEPVLELITLPLVLVALLLVDDGLPGLALQFLLAAMADLYPVAFRSQSDLQASHLLLGGGQLVAELVVSVVMEVGPRGKGLSGARVLLGAGLDG